MLQRLATKVLKFERWLKTTLFVISDATIIGVAAISSIGLNESLKEDIYPWLGLFVVIFLSILTFYVKGLYRMLARHLSLRTLELIFFCSVANLIYISMMLLLTNVDFFIRDLSLYTAVVFIGLSGTRLLISYLGKVSTNTLAKRVAIYGAGDAGRQLLKGLLENSDYEPVLLIDDNVQIQNMRILGLKVYSIDAAITQIEKLNIQIVLVAIPSADKVSLQNIFLRLYSLPVLVKSLPGLSELIDGKVGHGQLRTPSIEDLIGRCPVPPMQELIEKDLKNKVVLVSGAGGTIGSQLCHEIVRSGAKLLIMFDVSEFALYNLMNALHADKRELDNKTELHAVIGTVQNEGHMTQILENFSVEIVYHAAAYKHVPMVEENIFEGLKNNIFGTLKIVRSSSKAGVKNFILISTDKAVRPTNYMGASKKVAELICQAFGANKTRQRFSIVRFGNVLGSSGSVVPLFSQQILSGGPLTVTHKDVTRYFMTVSEAARLVIQAASLSDGGDILILDMGEPVKILDIAERMARLHGKQTFLIGEEPQIEGNLGIKIIGLRPGEKLHEELAQDGELGKTIHPRIHMVQEPVVPIEQLILELNELERACERRDIGAVNEVLNSLPIQFNHMTNNS